MEGLGTGCLPAIENVERGSAWWGKGDEFTSFDECFTLLTKYVRLFHMKGGSLDFSKAQECIADL